MRWLALGATLLDPPLPALVGHYDHTYSRTATHLLKYITFEMFKARIYSGVGLRREVVSKVTFSRHYFLDLFLFFPGAQGHGLLHLTPPHHWICYCLPCLELGYVYMYFLCYR